MKLLGIISRLMDRQGVPKIAPLRPSTFLVLSMVVIFLNVAVAPAQAQTRVPNFNGIWAHNGFDYPKPYLTELGNEREARGERDGAQVTDGYDNAYLKPWVVELLLREDLAERSRRTNTTDHTLCYPEGIPAEFGGREMQMLQTPSEITMLLGDANHSRTIYLNRPHSAHVVPSWYGESVGHFEDESLVVDTIGIAVHPETVSTSYGTPHTEALHVVERYRFLSSDEKPTAPSGTDGLVDPKYIAAGGKTLRLTFTVDDSGAYRKPWSVSLDYLPIKTRIREYYCAENNRDFTPLIPTAEIPDF